MSDESRIVTVVLVTWNSARYLARCIAGIRGQSHRSVEVIVVDNGSTDSSITIVRAALPGCVLIQNETNVGFSRAVNQAVSRSRGEFVLLCNPDAFLRPDYIARLIGAFDAAGPEFGAATGTLLRAAGDELAPTGVVDSKGIRMTRNGRHLDIGQGKPDGADDRGLRSLPPPAPPSIHEVFGVSGAAAMYRMSFIRAVTVDDQFLDEDFFAFREDADVCWRGRLFGWRALHCADAVAHHVRRVTPAERRSLPPSVNMHSVKNRFLLRLKNEGAYLALRNLPFELARDVVAIVAVLTIERTSIRGLTWLWKNRRRVLAKRRAVQGRRSVADRALAEWFG